MVHPFKVAIGTEILNDLQRRIAETRWPDSLRNSGWKFGTDIAFLKSLATYWQTEFNWRKQETHINSFSNFMTTIDGFKLHFIHHKSNAKHTLPLLLIHGYPDSFLRFAKLIPMLTTEDETGFAFDVVVPSIPGFGFSERPAEQGMNSSRIATLFIRLMQDELGYQKFMCHGGDWGSTISEDIARQHPEALHGIHLTEVPFIHLFSLPPGELTDPERRYLEEGQKWAQAEGAYAMVQSTKPQTLAFALNDSPIGLASWIVEKFYIWSDCHGDLESCFTKDQLLTNVTLYWVTETAHSSMRIYAEAAKMMPPKEFKRIEIPTAVAMFPKDLTNAPREYADRIFNIRQWTDMPRGGHFAALEQPDLLSEDIRKFAVQLDVVNVNPALVTPY